MPKRWKVRDQTKSDPLGGWVQGQQPYHIKTLTVTETRSVENKTTLIGGVAAGATMTLLKVAKAVAQDRKCWADSVEALSPTGTTRLDDDDDDD